jgi:hypothetical protein
VQAGEQGQHEEEMLVFCFHNDVYSDFEG